MPRYAYRCVECMSQFSAFHGFNDPVHCSVCGSSLCERIPSVGFSVAGVSKEQREMKVGEKVENFIKETKEELNNEKKKLEDER